MQPRVGLYVADVRPSVGSDLNTMRVAALKAIFGDTTLAALTENNSIFYDGLATQLDFGLEPTGEAMLAFTILYPLLPSEF